MNTHRFAWVWGLLAGLATDASAQESRLPPRLEAIARAALIDSDLPGLALQVTLGGEVVVARGLGYIDVSERAVEGVDVRRRADPLFGPLVAVALLQQVEGGRLKLDEPLSKHFPALTFGGAKVTVGQLLAHNSGVPSYAALFAQKGGELDAVGALAWLAERPLDFEPGTCFEYSESNTLLAAALLEKLAQQKLVEFLAPRVLEPAGMGKTAFGDAKPRAIEASIDIAGERRTLTSPAEWFGAGAIRTTLADLARFADALDGRRLLADAGRARLTDAVEVRSGPSPFTHGLARSLLAQHVCLSFGGASADSSVHVAWYPELDLVIALATAASTGALPSIERHLARTVLDLPEPGIVDLPTTAEQRASYLGAYYIGCTRVTIETQGQSLLYAWPYEAPFRLRWQGGHRFVSAADPDVRVEFKFDGERAVAFVLSQRGTETTARRIE